MLCVTVSSLLALLPRPKDAIQRAAWLIACFSALQSRAVCELHGHQAHRHHSNHSPLLVGVDRAASTCPRVCVT